MHFMTHEASLPCLQEPSTGPYLIHIQAATPSHHFQKLIIIIIIIIINAYN